MCYWNMPCSLGGPPGTSDTQCDDRTATYDATHEDCEVHEYGYSACIGYGKGVW